MICGICGRTLKGAKSIERGYGPICYQKIKPKTVTSRSASTKKSSGSAFDEEDYSVPGQMELSEFIEMPEGGQNND